METELAHNQSQENTQTFPPEPEPVKCGCGVSIRWIWVDRIENPISGKPFDWTEKWSPPDKVCEKCQEIIFEQKRKEREEIQKIKQAERIEEINNEITIEMGGSRTANWNFGSFVTENENQVKALTLAKKSANREGNLYLWGKQTGTGKSHLAGASYRYSCIEKRSWGYFWKPSALLRYMRVLDSEEQEKRLEKLIKAPILVIDDLGIGNVTDFSLQILYEIVDGRWMNESKGLIITANLSLDDLAKKLDDDRLPSRIAGMCDVIELKGKDRRINK